MFYSHTVTLSNTVLNAKLLVLEHFSFFKKRLVRFFISLIHEENVSKAIEKFIRLVSIVWSSLDELHCKKKVLSKNIKKLLFFNEKKNFLIVEKLLNEELRLNEPLKNLIKILWVLKFKKKHNIGLVKVYYIVK